MVSHETTRLIVFGLTPYIWAYLVIFSSIVSGATYSITSAFAVSAKMIKDTNSAYLISNRLTALNYFSLPLSVFHPRLVGGEDAYFKTAFTTDLPPRDQRPEAVSPLTIPIKTDSLVMPSK